MSQVLLFICRLGSDCFHTACLGGSCTSKDLGFRLDDILDSVGGDTSNLGGALRYGELPLGRLSKHNYHGVLVLTGLTFALVLHPIATAMAFLAFLFGICNVRQLSYVP